MARAAICCHGDVQARPAAEGHVRVHDLTAVGPVLMSEAAVTIQGLEVWATPPGALLVSEDHAAAGARLI